MLLISEKIRRHDHDQRAPESRGHESDDTRDQPRVPAEQRHELRCNEQTCWREQRESVAELTPTTSESEPVTNSRTGRAWMEILGAPERNVRPEGESNNRKSERETDVK